VEFAGRHRKIWWRVGSGKKPNRNFRWQCFGPYDVDHRSRASGFARENLLDLGSAYSDDILKLTKTEVADFKRSHAYAFPGHPVILFAPTWHYSEVLGHWGEDRKLLGEFFSWCGERSLNLLFRLHDAYRYDAIYRETLEELERDHPHVVFKYKNRHRDNLLDIAVADMAISNFSSILNYFYVTGRPSIHIYPVVTGDASFAWRRYKGGRLVEKKVDSPDFIWKLPLEENGGLTAHSFQELRDHVVAALADPGCCKDRSERFLRKYFTDVDGKTCERVAHALRVFALA
jgi:CDP-glycerol glycerophosphotransferase (TagB/SpsB family)